MVLPGIYWGHIKLEVPPKINSIKHVTTSDHDNLRLLDLSGGCRRHLLSALVCTVVPPVIASRPIFRGISVFNIHEWFLQGFLGCTSKLKVPPKVDNTKHATTSDHRILDLSGGCTH